MKRLWPARTAAAAVASNYTCDFGKASCRELCLVLSALINQLVTMLRKGESEQVRLHGFNILLNDVL